MFKFKSKKSKWNLNPEKKFKEMIKLLKTGKRSKFGFTEKEAIEYLGRCKDKRATKTLIDALKNSANESNKKLAVKALGEIGDESAIEPLIYAHTGTLSIHDSAINEAIKMFGEPAIKFLIQALNDVDYRVFWNIRHILKELGEASINPLLKGLEDERPQVRMRAAETLGYIGDTRAAEPLYQVMLNDKDENVNEEAAFALGEMKDKRAVNILIRVAVYAVSTRHSREKAIDLLGEIRDLRAVEPLIKIVELSRFSVGDHAAEALGKIGDERAVLPLIERRKRIYLDGLKWLEKNPPQFDDMNRSYVYKRKPSPLEKIGELAIEPLFQILQDEPIHHSWVLDILSHIGQPVVGPMIQALMSPCAKTRNLAAVVLGGNKWTEIQPFIRALHNEDQEFCEAIRGALQKDRAVDQIINHLSDESDHVRKNLVMVLGEIGDKKASEPLLQIMHSDTQMGVRREAILALMRIKDKSAVEPLIKILSHSDKTMRENAAKALGEIGDEKAIEPLIKILKSGDVLLIAVAEDALGKIGKSAIKLLMQTLREGQIELCRVLNALSKIGKPAIEPLFQLLGKEYAEADILKALVKIGPPAVKPLIHAIKHQSVDRKLGYDAIMRIGEPAVEPLAQLLSDKNVETIVSDLIVKMGKHTSVP